MEKKSFVEHKEEKHRVYECKICDKKSSSRFGLNQHNKQAHPEQMQEMDLEKAQCSGKRKLDSVVDRLTNKTTGNTITTTAGFMVVEKDGEIDEDAPESQINLKRRKLSERLQDPIKVKDRSKQVNVNSFRSQILTLKKKVSRMQREVGTEPDYVILMKNNLQDPHTSNPAASAGKYLVFGEGAIKQKLVKSGIKFDDKKMFLMANNHNFDEEKISKKAPVGEEVQKTKKRTTEEKNVRIKPRKVATPGFSFVDPSSSSEDSSASSAEDS